MSTAPGHANHTRVQAGFSLPRIFHALKAHGVMHHARIYPILGTVLAGLNRPFHLLDLGCADASDIGPLLTALPVAGYTGIDTSHDALSNAETTLARLSCPVRLIHGDCSRAWDYPAQSFDFIWMGLFLHHVATEHKSEFLLRLRCLLKPEGMLMVHDPLLQDGEDRASFVQRLEHHGRDHWPFLSRQELILAGRHWHEHGHQESFSSLHAQGMNAGFSEVRLLWSDPEQFYGLLLFNNGSPQ